MALASPVRDAHSVVPTVFVFHLSRPYSSSQSNSKSSSHLNQGLPSFLSLLLVCLQVTWFLLYVWVNTVYISTCVHPQTQVWPSFIYQSWHFRYLCTCSKHHHIFWTHKFIKVHNVSILGSSLPFCILPIWKKSVCFNFAKMSAQNILHIL
jgi:hypothetical protein